MCVSRKWNWLCRSGFPDQTAAFSHHFAEEVVSAKLSSTVHCIVYAKWFGLWLGHAHRMHKWACRGLGLPRFVGDVCAQGHPTHTSPNWCLLLFIVFWTRSRAKRSKTQLNGDEQETTLQLARPFWLGIVLSVCLWLWLRWWCAGVIMHLGCY